MRQLRVTLLAGLILFIIAGCILMLFYFAERAGSAATRQQDSFNRTLREYDIAFEDMFYTESEFSFFNGELDKLEKLAISVESWLSILKRRKALSLIHPPSIQNYNNSIENALKLYPHSQPIITVASAAIVKNSGISREIEEQLRTWLVFITDNEFNTLRLCLHVILGDFNTPNRALALPENIFLSSSAFNNNNFTGLEAINVNMAVLKAKRGDYRGAASDIQMLLNYTESADSLRFAAEYHYDFGNLLRSAEIFSYINDIEAMIRQADALFLAGYTEISAGIWNTLVSFSNVMGLYNLAVTTNNQRERNLLLERLVDLDHSDIVLNRPSSKAMEFGLIRYSRFLDYSAAISLLQGNANFSPVNYPYIDLEICKRHTKEQILGRQLAETWFLLDRHENNEELYRWAAWFFFFQRSLNETRILLDRLILSQLSAPWIDNYNAIQLMNDGNLDMAESILRSIPPQEADWSTYANLGRILETVRAPARAIEQYELASAKIELKPENLKNASRLQIRIARCFSAINRPSEAQRSLLYALDLDPGNLSAQLELDRLF